MKNWAGRDIEIKRSIQKRRHLVIFCLGLIVFGSLRCGRNNDRTAANESKITLLCSGRNEKNVFRDGGPDMSLLFLPLVFMDEERRPQPALLESWEHNDDFSVWTFHLRRDVKWHDGVPVTARDVKFTLELITCPDLMYEIKIYDEIEIIDDFTCQLRSAGPFNAFIYRWYGICPEHLLGDFDSSGFYDWDFWKQPVGNGPYRYLRHVPDTMVELEANPDYFGEKPKIDRVILKFGGNRITEILSGNVDAATQIAPLEVIKMGKDPRYEVYYEFNVTNVFSIIWNHQNPLFRESLVRRALTLAINRPELLQVLNLPENTPLYDANITPAQFHRGEVPEPLPYDPEQAKKILDAEGWREVSSKGIREKNGREFRFSLFITDDLMTTAVYVQDQFRKVGIHMEIVTMDIASQINRAKEGKFDAGLSRFMVFNSSWEFGGYTNPEFQQLLWEAERSPTVDKLYSVTRMLQPMFQADLPWLFLYPEVRFHIVHKRIRGLQSPHRAHPSRFMQHLWIEKEEQGK